MKVRSIAAAVLAALPSAVPAVYLSPDGVGQALVYPYYTAQSAGGNPFNTYLSVVNHSADAKALRVRFREGRMGAEVGSFNLFLSANDVWTGAVIPVFGGGADLITRDGSCRDGPFNVDFSVPGAPPYLEFRNTLYTGSNSDGAGDGLDRTREGYVEILEMGVLTGAAALAVTQNAAGVPANCAAVTGAAAPPVAAPSGGLSGTLTLINVASGEDFTVNAEALAELSTQPFYRHSSDAYPSFNAAEVTPLSVVSDAGQVYRSTWSRGVDAVTAVFMRTAWQAEFVLDSGTRSLTDLVVTSPTRHFYVTRTTVAAPYGGRPGWVAGCGSASAGNNVGEPLQALVVNREEANHFANTGNELGLPSPALCSAAATFSVNNTAAHMIAGPPSMVLGSINKQLNINTVPAFSSGWLELIPVQAVPLTSLATSTRIDLSTGASTGGSHRYSGLPAMGLFARVFQNGTLTCNAGARCQGNYGGAFPMRYRRAIQAN